MTPQPSAVQSATMFCLRIASFDPDSCSWFQSRTPTRFVRPYFTAKRRASESWPFCCSPSPMAQKTFAPVAPDLRGEREAHGRREALPEVARPPVDPRDVALDVSLERRAAAPEAEERQRAVEPPEVRERRVRGRRRVAVADDDAVAPRIERILRVAVAEAPEDELEVDRRHRAARMARRRERRHLEDVSARSRCRARRAGATCASVELRARRRSRGSRAHPARRPPPARRCSIVPRSWSYDFAKRTTPSLWSFSPTASTSIPTPSRSSRILPALGDALENRVGRARAPVVEEGVERLLGHRVHRVGADEVLDVEEVGVGRVLRSRRGPERALEARALRARARRTARRRRPRGSPGRRPCCSRGRPSRAAPRGAPSRRRQPQRPSRRGACRSACRRARRRTTRPSGPARGRRPSRRGPADRRGTRARRRGSACRLNMSVTLIDTPSPMRRRIAGTHSGVAGTLMKTFGRPRADERRFASATVFSVSAREGGQDLQGDPAVDGVAVVDRAEERRRPPAMSVRRQRRRRSRTRPGPSRASRSSVAL